jgi:hypothetical protein
MTVDPLTGGRRAILARLAEGEASRSTTPSGGWRPASGPVRRAWTGSTHTFESRGRRHDRPDQLHRDRSADPDQLVEPELIVLRCPPMPETGLPEGTVTRVELHDHGEKTRMTLSDGPYPSEARGHAEAGWNAAFEKLAASLAR